MRLTGPVKRTAGVLLAATIGTMAPGLTPLAVAQQANDSGQPATPGGSWRPPPVNMGAKPSGNNGQPLKKYKPSTECISSKQDLEKDVQITAKPWAQQYLRFDAVHELMRNTTGAAGLMPDGSPAMVGVVDTGVRDTHKWLPEVHQGGDYVTLESGKKPGLEDCDGHGTLVAGIIAANTPEGVGFSGLAPAAQIFSVRQSSANYTIDKDKDKPPDKPKGDKPSDGEKPPPDEGGDKPPEGGSELPPEGGESQPNAASTAAAQQGEQSGGAGSIKSLANAIVFTANANVDVMNVSIDNCQAVGNARGPNMAALHAAISYAVDVKDVVVVASAGNIDKKAGCRQNNSAKPRTIVAPPWFAKDVLSVAAIKRNGGVAKFSMHGPWLSVAAPGTHILSLDPAPGSNGLANLMIKDGKQSRVRGTSFAAPYVSGLAALVRAKYPNLDAHQVMKQIKATAQHPAAPGGRNQYVGYGVINPMAALTTKPATVESLEPQNASAGTKPANLPPPADRDWTPVAVALGGAGGAVIALLITLFTVHTIRRNRSEPA